jgi:hypothetical protein
MHTGQNSIAPESSLPQVAQVRWGCVLMALTVIRNLSRTQHLAPPSGAKSANGIRWRMMVRLQLRASVFSQGYQIRARIKIRDFEAQEFASLTARPGSRPEPNGSKGLEPITSANGF